MTTSAFAFHRQLVEQEGYDPTSDDYYKEVDRRMAESFPHKLGKVSTNTVNEVVAGSSRGSTTARTRSRRKVQLTPSQVSIAKRLGVPLEEYAKHIKE
jgi:transcriptional accessory protein Tex/SPT6